MNGWAWALVALYGALAGKSWHQSRRAETPGEERAWFAAFMYALAAMAWAWLGLSGRVGR